MKFSSGILQEAVEKFAQLPGIGKKTALRNILYLCQQNPTLAEELALVFSRLKNDLSICQQCHNISDSALCEICADSSRDSQLLCVVAGVRDVMAIEDTDQFRGRYHVLGGVISPIDGIGPEELNIDSLLNRVREQDVKEVIMAVNPTIEGETTIYYLSKQLAAYETTVTVLARGISFGGELEFADELTLGKSILTRTPYHMSQ